MRIGVHLQALRPGAIGGNEIYVRQLLRLLPEIDPHVRPVLFCADYNSGTFSAAPGAEIHELSAAEFDALDADRLRRYDLDLWFCPLLVIEPHEPALPTVVTIPDLQHESYPEFFSDRILTWRHNHYPRSARRADAVLTYSDFSRRQIIDSFGVSADKVHAIHLDAAPEFSARQLDDVDYLRDVAERHRLPDNFVFYPANDWPHKNHDALFRALGLNGDIDPSLGVVLTGAQVNGGELRETLSRSPTLRRRVRHLGYIDGSDLPALYALARGMVFPSLFEGFGLPVVEAMRAGCPVACSNVTGLPEVAGSAALLFDPRQPRQIASAIGRLTTAQRQQLIEKGRDRAQDFDWFRTTQRTLDVMRNACNPLPASITGGKERAPLITVITPSLQQGRFIEETLRSIHEQDYPRLEHWVIDGGSTDETLTILEDYRRRYPGRFDYVSEPDSGQAEAINKGIARARGDIIGWINSDDTYEPGSFEVVAHVFDKRPDRDLVYGRATFIAESGKPLWPYPTRVNFDWDSLVHECYICQPTVFWRRAVTDAGHRLDEQLQLVLDYDFWIRLGRDYSFEFVDRHIANSRVYRETKTLSRRDQVFDEAFRVLKRHYGWVPWSWALGRAHFHKDDGDAFFNALPVSRSAHLWALASLLRHNWSAPRHWRRMFRDLRPLLAQASRMIRRGLAPSSRRSLDIPASWLVAELGVEVKANGSAATSEVDWWWTNRHLARLRVNGSGRYARRIGLPRKEGSEPYRVTVESDLLRNERLRALAPRPYPVACEDGWLQQRDTLRLPGGWTEVDLTFTLPVANGGKIELRFDCEGRCVERWSFDRPGTYRRRLRIPSWAVDEGGGTELRFGSNAALDPDPARGETRRLALRLHEVVERSPDALETSD